MSFKTPSACPLCQNEQTVFYFQDPKNYGHSYGRCPRCALIFVLPNCRLDSDAEKARYDMHENDESEHYVRFLSRLADPMLSALQSPAKGLDFGSGKSPAMAKRFRQAGHDCVCYDIYYYPDPTLLNQSYDFIVASEVIEHLYDPKTVFELWLDLLSPNGLLGIMTGIAYEQHTNVGIKHGFADWWYKNDPTHVVLFAPQTFDYLEQQYGLKRVHTAKNVVLFRV